MEIENEEVVQVVKRGRGRPKGSKNKNPKPKILKERKRKSKVEVMVEPPKPVIEEPKKVYRNAGRKKGSLNKSTLEKIANREILDPRIYPPIKHKHPGRPKNSWQLKKEKARREQLLKPKVTVTKPKPKKLTTQERQEKCRQYAVDWCYKNKAELVKYSEQFFVFRYKNDPTKRRFQIGYEYGDYPIIWLPYTDAHQSVIEM